jgi:hypothetical protein
VQFLSRYSAENAVAGNPPAQNRFRSRAASAGQFPGLCDIRPFYYTAVTGVVTAMSVLIWPDTGDACSLNPKAIMMLLNPRDPNLWWRYAVTECHHKDTQGPPIQIAVRYRLPNRKVQVSGEAPYTPSLRAYAADRGLLARYQSRGSIAAITTVPIWLGNGTVEPASIDLGLKSDRLRKPLWEGVGEPNASPYVGDLGGSFPKILRTTT